MIDPQAEKFSFQSPYLYATNNPILFIDVNGENAWLPNGDGTWTAELGDGAETLAQDAGISKEKAYKLMEEQGYGTYVDKKDGVTKSAVDPGNVVDVNSKDVADEKKTVNNGFEILTNEQKIDKTISETQELKNDYEQVTSEKESYNDNVKDFNNDTKDKGFSLWNGINANKMENKKTIISKKIKRNQRIVDSIIKVNKKLKNK